MYVCEEGGGGKQIPRPPVKPAGQIPVSSGEHKTGWQIWLYRSGRILVQYLCKAKDMSESRSIFCKLKILSKVSIIPKHRMHGDQK